MRAYHWIFLLWVALFPAILATKDSIGYELLSQYYAYKMEARALGASKTKIAFGCPGTGEEGMCTFLEFIRRVSVLEPKNGSKTTTITWDYNYNGPGGPNTINPDISEVGAGFQNYVQPRYGYTFENVNAQALHQDFEKEKGNVSLHRRLNAVFESVQAARSTITFADKDPDLTRCRDAAERSSIHRALDVDMTLVSTLREIKTAEINVGGIKHTINIDVKTYTVADAPATIRASGGTTPDRLNAIIEMVNGVRKGKVPTGSDYPAYKLGPLVTHINALEKMQNYVTKLENC